MPLPLDTRKNPAAVKIHVSTGAGVDIVWSDGHTSHYDFTYLRENCPCATCDDARKKKAAAPFGAPTGATPGLGAELPMFKPKPKAAAAHAVGNYAIRIDFTDGHTTGIYSFGYLREICPCDACAREFRAK
ncbi:MAG TPA: DUF971 domain-containing protein [Candidatus Acidoferrales bacterium]|jgi:DUF971 family protein|nr:DUF971 domain-containing protein [Candidatus Acidoferrales bacterium]